MTKEPERKISRFIPPTAIRPKPQTFYILQAPYEFLRSTTVIKSFSTSWGTTKPAFPAESTSVNYHHWTVRVSQGSRGDRT